MASIKEMGPEDALQEAVDLMERVEEDVVERYAVQRQAELWIDIAKVLVLKQKRFSMYDDFEVGQMW